MGAVCVGPVSLRPRSRGSATGPVVTPSGTLASCGAVDVGLEQFIEAVLVSLQRAPCAVVARVFATCPEELRALISGLERWERVDGLEIELGSPDGAQPGINPLLAARMVAAARRATRRPLLVELPPDGDVSAVARAAEEEGADALVAVGPFAGVAFDTAARRPALGTVIGALSGPAIRPLALRRVLSVVRSVRVPVVGAGGIESSEDAREFLLAGASAVRTDCLFTAARIARELSPPADSPARPPPVLCG
ncbi:MAG: dihydroorotate dehydrogenase [Deltaproteobacteria bacterium]|nr:dihydroorotate dehydrogenase [Deltaproteobacteria bacterium]